MKPIEYIKDLLEYFRLRCENAWLKKKIRREQGEAKLKEAEDEVKKKFGEMMSSEKRED